VIREHWKHRKLDRFVNVNYNEQTSEALKTSEISESQKLLGNYIII